MAGLGAKLISGILNNLKKFFTRIPSIYKDFETSDSTGTIQNNIYIWRQTLTSQVYKDTNGKPLQIRVSIAATNVREISIVSNFNKALQNASSKGGYDFSDEIELRGLKPIIGPKPIEKYNDSGNPLYITTENAQEGSLLNAKGLKETAMTLNESWTKLADMLRFDVMCECAGYPSGKKSDQTWDQLSNCIKEYPMLCGAITNDMVPADLMNNNVTPVIAIFKMIQDNIGVTLDNMSKNFAGEDTPEEETEDMIDENDESFGGLNQSKQISMKLQKITGSTDIDLMAITANFNPGEALAVVDDVLSSPDFVDLITETPQSYEVLVDDEGYDVNPCTDLIVEPNENLTQLFIQANQFSRNLHMIHWLSIGNDMEKLHLKAEELYDELDEEIDLLAELIVEKTGTIVDINKIETWNTVGTQDRTFQQGLECIKQDAQSFIDYIDITYPNQPSDVQSVLDDWLRYWNKQLNYFIKREQE